MPRSLTRRSLLIALVFCSGLWAGSEQRALAQTKPPRPPAPKPAPIPPGPAPAPVPPPIPPAPVPPPPPTPAPGPAPAPQPAPAPAPGQPPVPAPPPGPAPPPAPAPSPPPAHPPSPPGPTPIPPAPLPPEPRPQPRAAFPEPPLPPGAATPALEPAPPPVEPAPELGAPPPALAPIEPAPAAAPAAPSPALPAPSVPLEVDAEPPPEAPASEAPIDVTVVGTRLSKTAGSAHVISNKQLERFEYDDPTAVLMSAPGLYVRTEDGMGLRPNIGLRGGIPDRSKKVTLMEDGVLFGPAPYSAPAAYYFPIITRMTKVTVVKGPSAISYGPQTVAGAIDLTTRAIPDETAAFADVAVGQYGYGKGHVWAGTSGDRAGFLVEGVRLQNNGFKELPNRADTGFARNEWMVKGSYLFDPHAEIRNELRLKLTYSDEVSNETYLGISDADFERDPNQRYLASQLDRMKNHRTSIVLTHVLEPNPNLSLTTNVYRHAFSRTWRKVNAIKGAPSLFDLLVNDDPEYVSILRGGASALGSSILIGPNEREFLSAGVESRLRWNGQTGPISHRLEAGVRYHYDAIDRRHSESGFAFSDGELHPDGVYDNVQVTVFNREYTHALAMHAAHAFTFRGLTVTPGLRAELLRSNSKDRLVQREQADFTYVVLPGVGAYYGIWRGLGVLAGVYEGFSPPPPGSAAEIEPEISINYEAGARFSDGPLRLELIGFYNDYRNFTDICSESSGCTEGQIGQQFDAGEARIRGLEALLEHELPVGIVKLPAALAYTYTRTEFLEDVLSADPSWGQIETGDEMPYVPRHQLRAQLGVEHRRAGLNAALTYVSRTREIAGQQPLAQTVASDRQLIVDLGAFAKIWGPLSLYANIQNLFDAQYVVSRRPFGARPNAPRWAHVGIKASF